MTESSVPVTKSAAQKLEGIAFTFCKCATVALLLGPWVLPGAAFLTALFYVLAYIKGQRDSRCVLHWPLLIAGFWVFVGSVALVLKLHPDFLKIFGIGR